METTNILIENIKDFINITIKETNKDKILTKQDYSDLKKAINDTIKITPLKKDLNGYDFIYEQDKIYENDTESAIIINNLIEITFNSKIKEWLDNETILLENGSTKKIQRMII